MSHRDPVEYYATHGLTFDRHRPRDLREKDWLDALLAPHAESDTVLDAGCGAGDPVAKYIAGQGFVVTGFDTTEAMLDLARERVPQGEFLRADLRTFELGRQFDALISWDSFFHLSCEQQPQVLDRFARHLKPRATLLFNAGHIRGEAINPMFDEPLYHTSLAPDEYAEILADLGFNILRHVVQDERLGGKSIWLAGRGL